MDVVENQGSFSTIQKSDMLKETDSWFLAERCGEKHILAFWTEYVVLNFSLMLVIHIIL